MNPPASFLPLTYMVSNVATIIQIGEFTPTLIDDYCLITYAVVNTDGTPASSPFSVVSLR
jgi:hypothetical protein